MKGIQSKKHKLGTKYLCHVLTIKDTCQMMEFIRWVIFIKIVLQAVKIFKKILIIKKDCDKKGKIAQKKLHISNMMN